MADKTSIQWTGATWNPIVGCSVVSPGCTNCYAMQLAGTRLKEVPKYRGLTMDTKAGPVWSGEVRLVDGVLDQPLRWRKPRMIFVNSMSDLFHENVPHKWIDKIFAVMALSPWHTYQVLTKRSDRMRRYLTGEGLKRSRVAGVDPRASAIGWAEHEIYSGGIKLPGTYAGPTHRRLPLPNIWLGVSAEDQARADERIPDLLAMRAATRFVSAEPLLGPIEVRAGWLHRWECDECGYDDRGQPTRGWSR